jgi:hypothetical protein
MKKTKLRDSNNYKSFGIYLTRNKIESAYSVASLFIDKFAKSRKPSDWQIVTADDLRFCCKKRSYESRVSSLDCNWGK